jgi:hypothetical protein
MLILLFGMENRTYFNCYIPGNAPGFLFNFIQGVTPGCRTPGAEPWKNIIKKPGCRK